MGRKSAHPTAGVFIHHHTPFKFSIYYLLFVWMAYGQPIVFYIAPSGQGFLVVILPRGTPFPP